MTNLNVLFFLSILVIIGVNFINIYELYQTNGYEPRYEPDRWNHWRHGNNCYAYALDNLRDRNEKPQPDNQDAESYSCRDMNLWINRDIDRTTKGYRLLKSNRDDRCPNGHHKIYLVLANNDYHFYRQDNDGLWSHKPGANAVSRRDASDNLIEDPSTADHNYSSYNYNRSCGFFCAPKIDEKF